MRAILPILGTVVTTGGVTKDFFESESVYSIYIRKYNFIQNFKEIKWGLEKYTRLEKGTDGNASKPMTPFTALNFQGGAKQILAIADKTLFLSKAIICTSSSSFRKIKQMSRNISRTGHFYPF